MRGRGGRCGGCRSCWLSLSSARLTSLAIGADSRRCSCRVLARDAVVARRVDASRCLERAGGAVVARRVYARRCLVLARVALVCPPHMVCVCVCARARVSVCVCVCASLCV